MLVFPAQYNAPNLIEVHISHLRHRLVNANVQIRSMHGYGYLIEIRR
jgi:DNA-binding response OmpR family regulator